MKSKVMSRLTGISGLLVTVLLATTGISSAAQPTVGLGTATNFAVLAGSTVTNIGPSVVSGDVGVSPGSAIVGFPPGTVTNGTIHADDAVAAQAQTDVTMAYDDAAGRPATLVSDDLGGQTLVPGVYRSDTGMGLTGTVTLDGQGDPNSVFIFQAGSTLITSSSSIVELVRGAHPCNVFWQVGSSATLATDSIFVGTVMALASVTVQTEATIQGRVLARNGHVTLDNNIITRPSCEPATTTPTTQPPNESAESDDGNNATNEDSGNGTNENSDSTMTTTGPDAKVIPPTIKHQPPDATLPKTGITIIPIFTLGISLTILGAWIVRKAAQNG